MLNFPANTDRAAFSGPMCRAVVFNREKGGPAEWGFYINDTVLLDADGKEPPKVWDIDTNPQFYLPTMFLPIK